MELYCHRGWMLTHVDEKELLILWLADRILDAIEGEKELQLYAIEVVKCELAKADL